MKRGERWGEGERWKEREREVIIKREREEDREGEERKGKLMGEGKGQIRKVRQKEIEREADRKK